MKKLWIAVGMAFAGTTALAQTTIYKHVDASGRVTYTNKPMKDAVVVDLEPLTTIPSSASGRLEPQPQAQKSAVSPIATVSIPAIDKPELKPAVAIVTPLPISAPASFASIDTATQKRRDEARRKILDQELAREELQLAEVRKNLTEEQLNPTLIAAVRMAQLATDPTPSQQLELRQKLDKASGRIRGLQATIAEHEKNIEALKKELGALKP